MLSKIMLHLLCIYEVASGYKVAVASEFCIASIKRTSKAKDIAVCLSLVDTYDLFKLTNSPPLKEQR